MAEKAVSALNIRKLAADAWNRFLRTFLQGMAIDVGLAVAVVIATNMATGLESWQAFIIMATAIGKTMLMSAAAYVMRRYMDASRRWATPLPPLDPTNVSPAWPETSRTTDGRPGL